MSELSRSFKLVVLSGVLLLIFFIGIGVYFLSKDKWRAHLSNKERGKSVHELLASSDLEERKEGYRLEVAYDREMAKILALNPRLKPVWKPLPAGENGFLKWLDFLEARGESGNTLRASINVSADLSGMIRGDTEWDGEIVKVFLEQEQALLNEIREIGLLGKQSADGVAVRRYSFMPAAAAINCMQLLCVEARLLAGAGDKDGALQSLRAALGLARHHMGVEVPSYTAAAIGIFGQQIVHAKAVRIVIPLLNLNPQELRFWRQELRLETKMKHSEVIKGDFLVAMRGFVMPLLDYDPDTPGGADVPDKDAMYQELARVTQLMMDRADGLDPHGQWTVNSSYWNYTINPSLSSKARKWVSVCFQSAEIYAKGFARNQALYQYYDAALAIAAGDEPPVEPITGKPFLFNLETRVLSFPDDPILEGLDVEEIILPDISLVR